MSPQAQSPKPHAPTRRVVFIDEWDLPPQCRRTVVGGKVYAGRKPTRDQLAQAITKAEARRKAAAARPQPRSAASEVQL